ncbi:MAG: hypothetical protein KF847_19800 [Pirellulales bacterium]|nr:hypothetical protein [Pirellulales bacterium]
MSSAATGCAEVQTMWQRGRSWCCSLVVDGRRLVRSFLDRDACEAAQAENIRDRAMVRAGLCTWDEVRRRTQRRRTIQDVADDLLADLQRRGRSDGYLRTLRQAIARVLDVRQSVGTIDCQVVRDRVARLGRTPRTRNHYLGAARAVTGHAHRQGWIERDPLATLRRETVRMGRTVRQLRALSPADAMRLLDEYRVRRSRRRLWYAVRLTTGIRSTEASRLLRGDLVARGGETHLVVRAEAAKTGQPRLLPLPCWVGAELLADVAWMDASQPLLPDPVTARTQVQDARRAGIGGRVLPAALRLTWDVWLDELGVSTDDQVLLAGRTGSGGAAITRWTYQDLEAALPRLRSHAERVGAYLRHGRTDAPVSHWGQA